MATKKRQQKLSTDGKQAERKKPRMLEKENVEEELLHQFSTDADALLLQQLDNIFLVKHPPELLTFWRHAFKLNAKKPLDAFSELDSLTLVGPFLLLNNVHGQKKSAKNCDNKSGETGVLLLASRCATDLPEMETVLVHRGGRFCYWRDEPTQMPNIFVHVDNDDDGEQQHFPTLTICGERDPFAAVQFLLLRNQQNGAAATAKRTTTTKQQSIRNSMMGTNSEQMVAHLFPDNYDMTAANYGADYLNTLKKRRTKEAIGKPFHGIGIKVAVTKNGIGYRPVSEDNRENAQLKRNIETMGTTDSEEKRRELKEKFYQMYSWVQFANDEMDFGMGLEFGHDLFVSNYARFDAMAKTVLLTAYELLDRKQFATILEKHMAVRRGATAPL